MLKLSENILMSATADDPGLWEFIWQSDDVLGIDRDWGAPYDMPDPLTELHVLRSMRELMAGGWAFPGQDIEVESDPSHDRSMGVLVTLKFWDTGADSALSRIQAEWRALGEPPFSSDVCRFGATELGRAKGLELLARDVGDRDVADRHEDESGNDHEGNSSHGDV